MCLAGWHNCHKRWRLADRTRSVPRGIAMQNVAAIGNLIVRGLNTRQ
ncbi:hypothetical protein SAMN05216593_10552 [Pseudomonas asturiensis]|uniref:Uncharacterized protein n=1 Tax=Pseudomonas asturiensis TaxID=1190415 RepID=A0A1M7N0F7_9PSED|nr:hypothetical protein SAMN05216593_10552 [Pseudomonas asturiensis]